MNSIKGRIIGGIIGFIFLNIIGLLLGVFFGYVFYDKPRIINNKRAQAYGSFNAKSPIANHALIESCFCLMGYVARGAGRINEEHISKVRELASLMDLDDRGFKRAVECFNLGKSEDFNLQQELFKVHQYMGKNEVIAAYILELQIAVALSDSTFSQEEQKRIENIGIGLGLNINAISRLIQIRIAEMRFREFSQNFNSSKSYSYSSHSQSSGGSYSYSQNKDEGNDSSYERQEQERERHSSRFSSADKLREAYNILGVSPDASFAEIKKIHRKLMLKYHPDRLASQGLSPEMLKLYTQKAQDIQAAFNLIKEHRGEK